MKEKPPAPPAPIPSLGMSSEYRPFEDFEELNFSDVTPVEMALTGDKRHTATLVDEQERNPAFSLHGSIKPSSHGSINAYPHGSINSSSHGSTKPTRQQSMWKSTVQSVKSHLWIPSLESSKAPAFAQDDILIAVMGMTGSGKTTLISQMTGLKMDIGHGLDSCTKEIQVATTQIDGRTVHLIDTPGFDDTELTDSDILATIAEYLKGDEIRLSGLLYLHRINTNRVGGSATKNLRMFRKLVGDDNMANVKLIATMVSKVTSEELGQRMAEMTAKRNFWGGMILAGATSDCYYDTAEDGQRLVRSILEKAPIILRLQSELKSGRKLRDTTAGREVSEQLEKLKLEYRQELDEMREEVTRASKAKNEELARELESHYQEILAKERQRADAEQRLWVEEIGKLNARIEDLENKKGGCAVM